MNLKINTKGKYSILPILAASVLSILFSGCIHFASAMTLPGYQEYCQLTRNANGQDILEPEIQSNYERVKLDVIEIVESEMQRIQNDPGQTHLVKKKK